MSERKTLIRKVIYIAIILVLLIPLSFLSSPAARQTDGTVTDGGILAAARKKHRLSQAELGDIDPSSATMRLATMGLGGVAVNLLWEKANEYKMKEDWINFGATLEQIVKLQPNFYKVWDFQAHNLSYNLSTEFDDYRDRYTYVIKGIHFLREGAEKNDREPRLLGRIGWYLGQKIGRSDEHELYRKLFKEDWNELFHQRVDRNRRPEERDNWLVAKDYFIQGDQLADRNDKIGIPLRTTPLIFFSERGKAQMNYAETLQLEGNFTDEVKRAWEIANSDWTEDFGNRQLQAPYGGSLRLNDQELFEQESKEKAAELEAISPGLREILLEEKYKKLTPAELSAAQKPADERTPAESELFSQIAPEATVSWNEVADRVPEKDRAKAKELANALDRAEDMIEGLILERGKVNFEYWRTRSEAEPEELTMQARRLVYEARELNKNGDPFAAIPLYEQAWEKWRQVIDKHPRMGDEISSQELVDEIDDYKRALAKWQKEFPKPFILQDIIEIAAGERAPDFTKKSSAPKNDPSPVESKSNGEDETKKGKQDNSEQDKSATEKGSSVESAKTNSTTKTDSTAKPDSIGTSTETDASRKSPPDAPPPAEADGQTGDGKKPAVD
ncbi:MAG: hypothetical protein SGJ20_18415 [Planctomycetota bacterium]|nr:hypothetical protein [Planctomycetota bacterium]